MIAPRITRLILTAFRSYPRLDLTVDASMVVLTGQNGAGKTNVLEAISLLTQGKGLRRAELEDMASEEAKASIEESLKLAESLGLNGTPSYVVGPNVVIGAVGIEALRERVNNARCGKATC